jgi:hypothetical protein
VVVVVVVETEAARDEGRKKRVAEVLREGLLLPKMLFH